MLDLTIFSRKLTQGRPPAEMTLAIQRQAESSSTPPQPAGPPAPATSTPLAATVDPEIIARRVYDLMRQELAVERERCGRWRL